MVIMIFYLVCLSCSVISVIFYLKMTNSKGAVRLLEKEVATNMESRSHSLCIRACHIDTMADTYERIAADEQLRDDIHQYVADFEAEVALRLKNTKQNTLSAYGGIRLH